MNLGNAWEQSIPSGGKSSTQSPIWEHACRVQAKSKKESVPGGSKQGEVRGGQWDLVGLWVLLQECGKLAKQAKSR